MRGDTTQTPTLVCAHLLLGGRAPFCRKWWIFIALQGSLWFSRDTINVDWVSHELRALERKDPLHSKQRERKRETFCGSTKKRLGARTKPRVCVCLVVDCTRARGKDAATQHSTTQHNTAQRQPQRSHHDQKKIGSDWERKLSTKSPPCCCWTVGIHNQPTHSLINQSIQSIQSNPFNPSIVKEAPCSYAAELPSG